MKWKILFVTVVAMTAGFFVVSHEIGHKEGSLGCFGDVKYTDVKFFIFDKNNTHPSDSDVSSGKYVWTDFEHSSDYFRYGYYYETFVDHMRDAKPVGGSGSVWHTLAASYRANGKECIMSYDFDDRVDGRGVDRSHERRFVYVNGDRYSVGKYMDFAFYDGLQHVGYMTPTIYR
jgi:hypothetical protein